VRYRSVGPVPECPPPSPFGVRGSGEREARVQGYTFTASTASSVSWRVTPTHQEVWIRCIYSCTRHPATPASLGGTWQVARCTPWETDCTFTCNALKHTHPNIRKREKLSSAHTIPRGSTARAQRAHLPTAGCTQKRETGSHCEALQNRP